MVSKTIDWRARALAVLRKNGRAMSAYEVLEKLRPLNPKIAPTTVYRALSALGEQGLVHRLDSMNAFVACQHHNKKHRPVLCVCAKCGVVQETMAPRVMKALSDVAVESGFAPTRQVIELQGSCVVCHEGAGK